MTNCVTFNEIHFKLVVFIMGYIYKLIDEQALLDAREGKISLSRPIFEFKGSEGNIVNFAKGIIKRFSETETYDFTTKDREEIVKWLDAFRKSYSTDIEDEDIITEACIIFYGILSAYCGYFTKTNLSNSVIRKEFINSNPGLHNKVGYIKIDESFLPSQSHWRSLSDNYVYERFNGDVDDLSENNGFLHPIDVEYIDNSKDYYTHLRKFNNSDFREAHLWFTLIDNKYCNQNEKRLVFLLRSLKPNSCRIAAPSKYNLKTDSIDEKIFGVMVDTIDYCLNEGKEFIYLKLDKKNIEIKEF